MTDRDTEWPEGWHNNVRLRNKALRLIGERLLEIAVGHSWFTQAACRDPLVRDFFVPEGVAIRHNSRKATLVHEVCGQCPVFDECHQFATEGVGWNSGRHPLEWAGVTIAGWTSPPRQVYTTGVSWPNVHPDALPPEIERCSECHVDAVYREGLCYRCREHRVYNQNKRKYRGHAAL